jgi:hypothetical protein
VDLAAVFLLSLLGGYYFFYFWRLTAFGTRRSEGRHLYFRAALGGIVFFGVALAIRTVLLNNSSAYAALDLGLVEYVKPVLKTEDPVGTSLEAARAEQTRRAEWVVTAGYSLLVGILAAGVLNLFTSRSKALQRSLGPLDRLLFEAQLADLPVNVTLKNGKTYIGLVQATPDPGSSPNAVSLLPMFSGSRDANGRMVLTTDYETLYQRLVLGRAVELGLPDDWFSHFRLMIPAESILTASLFSPAIYAEFNPLWRERIAMQHVAGDS